jgi:NAD+ kinase
MMPPDDLLAGSARAESRAADGQRRFGTIALIGKYRSTAIAGPLRELAAHLRGRGVEVLIDRLTASNIGMDPARACTLEEIGPRAGLAIVIGGDGTMLNIARTLAPFGVPLVGVNQGRLGFLTDIPLDAMVPGIDRILDGHYSAEPRLLIEASIVPEEGGAASPPPVLAFNDVVVSKGERAGMVEFDIRIGRQYVNRLRADGLIIASPTGSTAYALSSGGPIIHPSVAVFGLVPISPHTLSNRPIVIGAGSTLEIRMHGGSEAVVRYDSHSDAPLGAGRVLRIRRSDHDVILLHPEDYDYFHMLREKLKWSESL